MGLSPETKLTALKCIPHLVKCAEERRTITYGELAQLIGKHHRPSSFWLAYIRDELCVPNGYPILTAIVVRREGVPGVSYLASGTDSEIGTAEYAAEARKVQEDVFAFRDWARLREYAKKLQDQYRPPEE